MDYGTACEPYAEGVYLRALFDTPVTPLGFEVNGEGARDYAKERDASMSAALLPAIIDPRRDDPDFWLNHPCGDDGGWLTLVLKDVATSSDYARRKLVVNYHAVVVPMAFMLYRARVRQTLGDRVRPGMSIQEMRALTALDIPTSGLWISADAPELGASLDGVYVDHSMPLESRRVKVVEIKAPHSRRNKSFRVLQTVTKEGRRSLEVIPGGHLTWFKEYEKQVRVFCSRIRLYWYADKVGTGPGTARDGELTTGATAVR